MQGSNTDFESIGREDVRGFESSQSDDGIGSLRITEVEEKQNEITTRHWVTSEQRPFCANKSCGKKFNLVLTRLHHCRKCGDVFCSDCLQYKRKLNLLANYDPEGKSYKVCKPCFEADQHTDGFSRRWTEEFRACKILVEQKRQQMLNGSMPLAKSWRNRVDLATECERLRQGFQLSMATSEMRRTLSEMKNVLVTPDWQKSSLWLQESLAEHCKACGEKFSFLRKKYSCKVCGQVLCKSCCRRELLVYVPDSDHNSNVNSKEACISVIKVVGSPEKEPDISLLLHICGPCQQFLVDRQLSRAEEVMHSEDTSEGVVSKLMTLDIATKKMQWKITEQLTQYQGTVESLEDGRKSTGAGSNTKLLAKAQGDLSDHFATYSLKIPTIKKLLPECETETQRKLVQSFLKAKSYFYLDNVCMFRALRRKLSESAPAEVLDYIQKIVDKNFIVVAQAYIQQLTFEMLHLCDKYPISNQALSGILMSLYKVVEEDARVCLRSQGEDIEQHEMQLKHLVETQLKDHRLISPSSRRIAMQGTPYVAELLLRRVREVLLQSKVQLEMITMVRSFQKTKEGLRLARKEAHELTVEQILRNK